MTFLRLFGSPEKKIFFFSVPEEFKTVWTRDNKLRWKDVKRTFICNLHFEAKFFIFEKKLDYKNAVPLAIPGEGNMIN